MQSASTLSLNCRNSSATAHLLLPTLSGECADFLFLRSRIATLPGRDSRGRSSKPTAAAHFSFAQEAQRRNPHYLQPVFSRFFGLQVLFILQVITAKPRVIA